MKINTGNAIISLFWASRKDPRTQMARLAVMQNGNLEVTKKSDLRSKAEGVTALLNPYEDGTTGVNMTCYPNGQAALADRTLHKIVAKRLTDLGAEVVLDV